MAERAFPLDFSSLVPDSRPRRFLVLPPGFTAAAEPDAISPVFNVAPEALMDAFIAAGLAEPRTELVHRDSAQAELVQRSLVFRFPDYVTVEVVAQPEASSALAIYSRAVLGYSDMGVNAKRVKRWLAATADRLKD
ncbi:MAG: DUF1499 domain-containing protein [Pseudomonadota bacterium]